MGADGGVAWVQVYDLNKFLNLLAPWLGWFDSTGSDIGDSSRSKYWNENSLPPSSYVSNYGTDLGNIQLYNLPAFIYLLEDLIEDGHIGLGEDATFADILQERQTRPAGYEWGYQHHSIALEWVDDFVFDWYKDKNFFNYRVKDWIQDLDEVLSEGRVIRTVETWT